MPAIPTLGSISGPLARHAKVAARAGSSFAAAGASVAARALARREEILISGPGAGDVVVSSNRGNGTDPFVLIPQVYNYKFVSSGLLAGIIVICIVGTIGIWFLLNMLAQPMNEEVRVDVEVKGDPHHMSIIVEPPPVVHRGP